jgi:small subunit ribosomal protein S8
MAMTDPLADLLTRVRNANRIGRATVDCPASNLKLGTLAVLKREGFIRDYRDMEGATFPSVRIWLKYGRDKEKVIRHIQRVSRPGCRVYAKVTELDPVLDGVGMRIISTPRGVLSDREAREQNVGGEILAEVW